MCVDVIFRVKIKAAFVAYSTVFRKRWNITVFIAQGSRRAGGTTGRKRYSILFASPPRRHRVRVFPLVSCFAIYLVYASLRAFSTYSYYASSPYHSVPRKAAWCTAVAIFYFDVQLRNYCWYHLSLNCRVVRARQMLPQYFLIAAPSHFSFFLSLFCRRGGTRHYLLEAQNATTLCTSQRRPPRSSEF